MTMRKIFNVNDEELMMILFNDDIYQSLAYLGNKSGVNLVAAAILEREIYIIRKKYYFPLIFILPYMNAYYGLTVP